MSRYRIKRVPFTVDEYDAIAHPYGLWDKQTRVYVNKYSYPDDDYWCISRDVAVMRRRDLNEYAKGTR